MDKVYYLQEIELAILLSAMGQKELYGYPLPTIHNTNERQIHQAIFEMTRKGILEVTDKGIQVQSFYAEMMKSLIQAEQLWVYSDAEQYQAEIFLYIAERAIMLQAQSQTGNIIRIEIWNRSEISERLLQRGLKRQSFLEKEINPFNIKLENMKELETEIALLFSLSKEALLEQKKIISAIQIYNIAKKSKYLQLVLLNDKLEDFIVVNDSDKNEIYPYSDTCMKNRINKVIGEKI